MSAPDYASAWRDRARAARSVGDDPTADYCESVADFHDEVARRCNEDRLRASIARLDARDD